MSGRDQLLQLISFIDLTSLDATDNEQSLINLIDKANQGIHGIHPAAVCVYPNFGNAVSASLKKGIHTAVVGGYFPSGQTLIETKLAELQAIEKSSVNEVDIVINRGAMIGENFTYVRDEILQMRQAAPTKIMKVILETGELKSEKLIQIASEISIECGADFIKTSTGKSQTGATPDAVKLMCAVIKNHFEKTGKRIGIKPSGGIRTIEEAMIYTNIVQSVLGNEWLTPALFRIGASSLYDSIISELKNAGNN